MTSADEQPDFVSLSSVRQTSSRYTLNSAQLNVNTKSPNEPICNFFHTLLAVLLGLRTNYLVHDS